MSHQPMANSVVFLLIRQVALVTIDICK